MEPKCLRCFIALCSIHVAVAGFTTETTGWIKPESHGGTLLVASDAGCNLKIVVPQTTCQMNGAWVNHGQARAGWIVASTNVLSDGTGEYWGVRAPAAAP